MAAQHDRLATVAQVRMQPSSAIVSALLALAACARGEPELARAVHDTLPGGIARVMSPGPTAWADTADPRAWRLVADGVIRGESGTPAELIDPRTLAVDGEGRIYVSDQKPAVIKVFSPSGELVRTIGREGDGPGEFRAPFIAVQGPHLAVHDPQASRTSVFDTAGVFLRSWPSSCCSWMEIAVDHQGLIYVPTAERDAQRMLHVVRYALDGTLRDTLKIPDGPEPARWEFRAGSGGSAVIMLMQVPLSASLVRAYLPGGGVVYGHAERFELVRTGTRGDTSLVFGRTWSAEPIPDSVRRAAVAKQVERLTRDFEESMVSDAIAKAEVPHSAPPYSGVEVDGRGNAWVRVGADDGRLPVRFDVFSPDGAWLGRVIVDANIPRFGPKYWGEDVVYAVMENEEGVPAIHRFRIERRGGE